ncbi:MAG TPA: hypothetical protein DF383_12335, partial [Deltaproteobacteria bacterium]|nr:hypothetical protein [Deltaproteobacteria bacterium]
MAPPTKHLPLSFSLNNIDAIGNKIIEDLEASKMPEQIALANDLKKVPLSSIWRDTNQNGAIDLTNNQGDVTKPEFTDAFLKDKKNIAVIDQWAAVLMGKAYLINEWRDIDGLDPKKENRAAVFSAYDWEELRKEKTGVTKDFTLWNGIRIYVDTDPTPDGKKVFWAISMGGSQDSQPTLNGTNPGLRHQVEHPIMRTAFDGKIMEDYLKEVRGGRGRWIFTSKKQLFISAWNPNDSFAGVMKFLGRAVTTPPTDKVIANENKNVIFKELAGRDDDLGRVIFQAAEKAAYPPGHPEGQLSGGTIADIKAGTPAQVRKDHAEMLLTPYRMSIHVIGNITRDEVNKALNNPENSLYHLVPRMPARYRSNVSVPADWSPSYTVLKNVGNQMAVAYKLWQVSPATVIRNPAALNLGLAFLNYVAQGQFVGDVVNGASFEYNNSFTMTPNAYVTMEISGSGAGAKKVLAATRPMIRQIIQGPVDAPGSTKQRDAWKYQFESVRKDLISKVGRYTIEERLYGDQFVEDNGRTVDDRNVDYKSVKWEDVVEMLKLIDKPSATLLVEDKNEPQPWSAEDLRKIDLDPGPVPPREIVPAKATERTVPPSFTVAKVLKSTQPKVLSYNRLEYELNNGVRVTLVLPKKGEISDPDSATIALHVPFTNPEGKQGYSRLVGENLMRSPGFSKETVAVRFAEQGAEYEVAVSRKGELRLFLTMPPDKVDAVTGLAFQLLTNPARKTPHPDDAKNFEGTKNLVNYKRLELAGNKAFVALYGLDEALGVKREPLEFGTPQDLQNISAKDLKDGHLRFINPRTLQVTAAGISEDLQNPQTKALFYELSQLKETNPPPVKPAAKPGPHKYPRELERTVYLDKTHLDQWKLGQGTQVYYTEFQNSLNKNLAGDRILEIAQQMLGPRPKEKNYFIFRLAVQIISDKFRIEGTGVKRWVKWKENATPDDPIT